MSAPRIRGVGIVTGWGDGVAPLAEARGRPRAELVPVPTPVVAGERLRRATRECLLGTTAVRGALADGECDGAALAGDRTGMLYVSATAYAAANRAFLEDERSTTLHFPYTAPSAVPGEVTIEFEIRGPYMSLMGGGTAALQGLWFAACWLADGVADRVLVLAVEAMHEVRDLFTRARRLYEAPLVEGAACLLLEPGDTQRLAWASSAVDRLRAPMAVDGVLDAVLP
ncbi:MAG: beta-ketoacyl synthase N-terminal-like domain-containing protein, partial [Candidatus Rokuibacteriota bacterium]